MKKFKIIFQILSYIRKILLKLLNSCNDFLKSIKEQIEDEEKRKKEFLIKKNEFKKNLEK